MLKFSYGLLVLLWPPQHFRHLNVKFLGAPLQGSLKCYLFSFCLYHDFSILSRSVWFGSQEHLVYRYFYRGFLLIWVLQTGFRRQESHWYGLCEGTWLMCCDKVFAYLFAGDAVCRLGDQVNSLQRSCVCDKYNESAEEMRWISQTILSTFCSMH